jgi:hypothetical protein
MKNPVNLILAESADGAGTEKRPELAGMLNSAHHLVNPEFSLFCKFFLRFVPRASPY